jgi:multiple sugar transport system substrate-binding protein
MIRVRRFRGSWLFIAVGLLLGISTALLTGCELPPVQPTSPLGQPTSTSVSQPEASATPAEGEISTPTPPSTVTLTIWTTESFSPTQAITSGQILLQEVALFEETHPDVDVEFVLKQPYGKGGILDFLLTTQAVVPGLLPDLAFIDVDELGSAVQSGAVQPLDDLLPSVLVSDLYPFARSSCSYDGQLHGLQYYADMDHLVYNTGRLTVPPSSWPGVLTSPGTHLFPAGGQAGLVNDSFLIQYLAARSWPSDGGMDAPFLEAGSLTAVLQFYQDGITRGVFPLDIIDYQTTDDCWRDYVAGQAVLSHVSAHRYLTERDSAPSAAAALIPAINGAGTPLSRGWALALVASDPARQSLAIDFVIQLSSPQTNAAWNQAANYLPTRLAALDHWPQEDSYTRFAGQMLETAQSRPRLSNYTQLAAALQAAVTDVINGDATPEEAATQAIENAQ